MAKKSSSVLSVVLVGVLFLLLFFFVPPFSLLFLPLRMMLERKPETIALQGVPIAQAIVDYQNEHGAFPEKIIELVPKYLPKEPAKEWSIQFNGQDTCLRRQADQPHSYICYWFEGYQAGQWRYYPDSADKNYQLSIAPSVPKKTPLAGEAKFVAQVAEYENRIRKHPHEIWYYEDKICFLGISNRTELLLPECERAAKEFPDWWLPQLAPAIFSPTNETALKSFDSWVHSHGTHVNLWLLFYLQRERGNTSAALDALREMTDQPFVYEPVMVRWQDGVQFLSDACAYAYSIGDYKLMVKVANYWETNGHPHNVMARYRLQAVAELKLELWELARNHALEALKAAKKDDAPTIDLEKLLVSIENHDTNIVLQLESPDSPWTLFRAPTP